MAKDLGTTYHDTIDALVKSANAATTDDRCKYAQEAQRIWTEGNATDVRGEGE